MSTVGRLDALPIVVTQGRVVELPASQMLLTAMLEGKASSKGSSSNGLNTLVQKWHKALQLKNSLTRSYGAWFHPSTRGTESIVMNRTKDIHLLFVSLFLAQIDLLE